MYKSVHITAAFGVAVGLTLAGLMLLPLAFAEGGLVTSPLVFRAFGEFVQGLFRTLLICCMVGAIAISVAAIQCAALASGEKKIRPLDYVVLAPLFTGEVVLGFIYKSILGFNALGASLSTYQALCFYYAIHALIFGLLMGQLITILIGPVLSSEGDAQVYFRSLGMGDFAFLRRYIVPRSVRLIWFVSLLIFVVVGQQTAFGKLAFHPSQAQHNELWTHVLDRGIRDISAIDPSLSPIFYSIWNFIAAVALVIFAILGAWALPKLLRHCIGGLEKLGVSFLRALKTSVSALLVLNLVTVFVIPLWTLANFRFLSEGWELSLSGLGSSVAFAMVSSLLAVVVSSAAWARAVWACPSHELARKWTSLAFVGLVFALFVPRKAIGMGALAIVQFFPSMQEFYLAPTAMWLATHALCMIPLAALYLAAVMSSTASADGVFIRSHGGGFVDFLTRIIVPRYWKEMTILVGFCTIMITWDYPINEIFYAAFDEQAPSLAELIVNAIESRRASISFAAVGILITGLSTSGLLLLLQRISSEQSLGRQSPLETLQTSET